MKISDKKEEILALVQAGKIMHYTDISERYGIPIGATRVICKALGIIIEKTCRVDNRVPSSALLTVLARVCRELNINHDEIKPYL